MKTKDLNNEKLEQLSPDQLIDIVLQKELKIQEQHSKIKKLTKELNLTGNNSENTEATLNSLKELVEKQNMSIKEKWEQLNANSKVLQQLHNDLLAKEEVINNLSENQKAISNSLSWKIGWRTTRVMYFFLKWIPGMKDRLK
ncbi:MAG: hypothetical protein HKN09_10440 [Saprospiraceae bacterium]|nr:hypothetical protein [Saprospiraceae bacterium]